MLRRDDGQNQASLNDIVIEAADVADLRLARFVYCDLAGILRGKASHAAGLGDRLIEGVGLARAQLAMDVLDRIQPAAGLSPVGEVRLIPDPSTFTILPYAPRTAMLLCDLVTLDREPWEFCPRSALQRVLTGAERRNLSIEAAFETEYSLGQPLAAGDAPFAPLTAAPGYSLRAMQAVAGFTDALLKALEAQNVPLELIQPETGPGQYELSVRHAPAMQAADTWLVVKETVRAVAEATGAFASFAPVAMLGSPASGAHIHLSLWDTQTGENRLFDRRDEHGFSDDGRRFIAGVLAHLPALVALTCASVNSYRRLKPGNWAGAWTGWGFDNREMAIRVPSTFWGREQGTTNIELRAADNTCNPYLALAGVVAAGLSGLERDDRGSGPIGIDPVDFSVAERESRGLRPVPASFGEALGALEQDDVIRTALGDPLITAYLAVRRAEVAHYAGQPEAVEIRDHTLRY